MATRKRATTKRTKKTDATTPGDKNQYVHVKKSCNNLSGCTFPTLDKAKADAKEMLENTYSYYWHKGEPESVTIYKLVPVERIIKKSEYTEETL